MFELKRIKDGSGGLRDDVVICNDHSPVQIGSRVEFVAKPRDAGDFRWITTSAVTDISFPHPNITRIKTESGSIYEITKL